MVTVSATARLAATPDAVFDIVDTPKNHQRLSPSLSSVYDVDALDGGGHRALYTYRLFGVPLPGSVEVVEHDRPTRLRVALRGGVDGEMDWRFAADGAGTVVTCEATFTVPGGMLASLFEPVVRRYNQQELEETLGNLGEMLRTTE